MRAPSVKRSTKPAAVKPRCTLIGDGQEVRIPETAWTLDGFRAWAKSADFPPRGRISYIGGEIIIDMSPEEIEHQVQVKCEICAALIALNRKVHRGKYYGDGTLVSNAAADLSNEPDGTFTTWESLESGGVQMIARESEEGEYMELKGSPDWVLEVVSKYSERKDTLLRDRYYRAGISEYWLVNARGKKVDLQILHHGPQAYVAAPQRGRWQYSRVFERYFHLERKRDRGGLWEYTLLVKK